MRLKVTNVYFHLLRWRWGLVAGAGGGRGLFMP